LQKRNLASSTGSLTLRIFPPPRLGARIHSCPMGPYSVWPSHLKPPLPWTCQQPCKVMADAAWAEDVYPHVHTKLSYDDMLKQLTLGQHSITLLNNMVKTMPSLSALTELGSPQEGDFCCYLDGLSGFVKNWVDSSDYGDASFCHPSILPCPFASHLFSTRPRLHPQVPPKVKP